MVKIGYKLSSEEFGPLDLVCYARQAEEAGFDFAMISDHYHPWISNTGESPFVWCTLGGISQVTEKLPILTGVTCPTFRIHPAIIAQAAATAATILPGRFILGVGSGENLNEHILGDQWPPTPVRIEMLEEAIDIIRTLWQGGMQDYNGCFYDVENVCIYTLPKELPPIFVAAAGPIAANTAGKNGDGLITTGGKKEIIDIFKASGGEGKPCYTEVSVCWDEKVDDAMRIVIDQWPIKVNDIQINSDLQTPTHFEKLAENIDKKKLIGKTVCGPDPQDHINKIKEYIKAGYNHICVHQVGNKQREFIEFYKKEVLPEFR